MRQIKSIHVILAVAGFIFLSAALFVYATSKDDIVYPVKELGNCKNQAECEKYCEDPKNIKVCVDFAEEHGIMSADEAKYARRFMDAGQGPGGCRSQQACETYCNDVSNISECLTFAERYNLMPREELEEAKKVEQALAKGAKLPGGCRNKQECEAYCEDSSRIEECVAFAETAGFISGEELENAKKFMAAVKKGVKAPPCRGKAECDTYCAKPANFEVCITFAEAAGFIDSEEAAMARKTGGKGPGDCRGKEACEKFCEDDNNMPQCIEFAIEHGLMSPEDAEMARKTGGKGPGGCKGREKCDSFCKNPANEEACFNFAKEHGLLSEEDLQRMEEGKEQILEALESAPEEVQACFEEKFGQGVLAKLGTGEVRPSEKMGNAIGECFKSVMPSLEEFGPGPEDFGDMEEGQVPPPQQLQQSPQFQQLPPQQQEQFQKEYQKQYEAEYQKRYEEESKKQYEEQVKSQVDCSLFAAAPTCDYAGAPGSQNYNLCKQCFPDR